MNSWSKTASAEKSGAALPTSGAADAVVVVARRAEDFVATDDANRALTGALDESVARRADAADERAETRAVIVEEAMQAISRTLISCE
jgi:hypothetical protein